ncbi:sodium-dependent nutrient amino acid transporter 1-like isoform X2 [Anthonomus grandis grandis]|uniref:sodium-dependent nutrient amino acid transporter 1-like isoform X2 n=1 Tax=Anthonomus grandis grandis TaxID=2921223 RepID=UPI00216532B3|nr:sodium-dependent nutrient amino acid transporter 1-like isoform X2 [Anthonomus grandis grandis]
MCPNIQFFSRAFIKENKRGFGVRCFSKKGKLDDADDDIEERAQWGHGLEFLMSCIAMSVGLGNIWRFPFTAKENGGGAFLIPYVLILTVIGRPLYYMEMALGQFSSKGNVKMYEKLSPVFKAIGFGQLIGTICVATYYCCLMAITLFYLAHSFTNDLPWTICNPSWNSDYLDDRKLTCINSTGSELAGDNRVSSSELWFRLEVLRQKDDISDGIGIPDWRLTLCLLASWIVTFLVSIRGVKSSGKAAYFLALFPYVIMIALLIRAATLEGADKGMLYFIETDWNKLKDASVWYAAVTQCFFSLNVGFGSIIMYSSYNPFRHNINRDALIVTTLDTFTSLLSGATIFGILGNLAFEMDEEPANVITSGGTGLAFISYPEAIAKFNHVPWLFAILFFFMLFILAIGSLAALQNCVNTVIKDSFPSLKTWMISAITASAMFFVGLIYVTPGGQYMLDLVDHFGGTFIIFVFAILEVYAVVYLYGIENLCLDLEYMTGHKPGIYWRFCWGIIMPILLVVIFVYFVATLKPLTYGEHLLYPPGILAFGWCILGVGVLQTIIWVGYYAFIDKEYPIFSTETWGPSGTKRTADWKRFKIAELERREPKPSNCFTRQMRFIFLGR